jgi:hypothetical protein
VVQIISERAMRCAGAAGGRLRVEVAGLDPVDEAVPVGERLDPLAWTTLTRELDLLVSALQVDPSS